MKHHSSTTSFGYISLDAWSEAYVGAHWVATRGLPANGGESLPWHGPLSQMVLLASHHLVEVMFFRCVRSIIKAAPCTFPEIEAAYGKARFRRAIEQWPETLVGKAFDFDQEPMKSVIRLSERRNTTIHKDSALATPEVAKSALYSAMKASETVAVHLLGPGGFKYTSVLRKYPIQPEPWFSEVGLVDAIE